MSRDPHTEQGVNLSVDEIKALLWATAPYSDLTEIHESHVVARSIALIRAARAKLTECCS